jgi:hypothetical protein
MNINIIQWHYGIYGRLSRRVSSSLEMLDLRQNERTKGTTQINSHDPTELQ